MRGYYLTIRVETEKDIADFADTVLKDKGICVVAATEIPEPINSNEEQACYEHGMKVLNSNDSAIISNKMKEERTSLLRNLVSKFNACEDCGPNALDMQDFSCINICKCLTCKTPCMNISDIIFVLKSWKCNLEKNSKKSTAAIADTMGLSPRTIQRFISLANLQPELFAQLNRKKLPISVAFELTKLSQNGQKLLANYIADHPVKINIKRAKELYNAEKEKCFSAQLPQILSV